MAFLLHSTDTTRFSSTVAIAYVSGKKFFTGGAAAVGKVPAAAGTASVLHFYVTDWSTVANLKACIYEDNTTLIATKIIPASAGTGHQTIALDSPITIDITKKYHCAFYSDTDATITFASDTAGTDTKNLFAENASGGTYASPSAAIGSYSYISQNEFYWALEETASRSITDIDGDNNVQAGQSTSITGLGFDLPIVSATLAGEPVTVTGTPTDTNIDVTIPLHINAEWGSTTNDLVVTDQTGALTLSNVTLSAPTGWEEVTFTTAPNPATTESFYELSQTDAGVGNFTAATGDILSFESQTGLTVDGQTIPVVDPPATVSGSYKWWDVSLATWTDVGSFTINDLGFFGSSASNIILRDVLKPVLSNVLRNISEE